MQSIVEKTVALANRESLREVGHVDMVVYRVDGEKCYKTYDSLTGEEIADFRRRGIIL